MSARYENRKAELLAESTISPEVFTGLLERLRPFAEPFLAFLGRSEQVEHARTYLGGLLSDIERKNAESIAYFFDQARDPLQHFLGRSPWNHKPLLTELARQVGTALSEPDGVLVLDPCGFAKKGDDSVGVSRQWLGRFGKVDNGQVGIYLAYVTRREHALVDLRLYLPEEWTRDYDRRAKAGVPKEIAFQTRHALALDMLRDKRALLPHTWITGDDEMGRSSKFRADLRALEERYLLAVPCNTTIRDLDGQLPTDGEGGSVRLRPFEQVQEWIKAVPPKAWTPLEVRDGEKGPLAVQVVTTRVRARDEDRCIGPEELLVVIRSAQEDGSWKTDFYLSNAAPATERSELARVAKAEHRIEECFQRAKSEAGLADYETRTWQGWHHHQTLCLLASWFLVTESLRGKAVAPAVTVPMIRLGLALLLRESVGRYDPERIARFCTRLATRSALARYYAWKARDLLAPLRINQRR
jgi:SRSO17 transposase